MRWPPLPLDYTHCSDMYAELCGGPPDQDRARLFAARAALNVTQVSLFGCKGGGGGCRACSKRLIRRGMRCAGSAARHADTAGGGGGGGGGG